MDSPKKRDRAESRHALWAVIQREMRETAWRKRTFFTRALSVFFLGTVFFLTVFALNSAEMASRYIFNYLAFILALFLALILPILVGDVIASERERGTLGLLFLTPLRPLGIVLGKATGRILLILSFMVACAPVVALTYLLGGVEAMDILRVFIAAFFSVIWGVTFCLWMSARSATVTGSTIACYAWGVIILGAIPLVQGMLIFDMARSGSRAYFLWTLAWHPFLLWQVAIDGSLGTLQMIFYILAGTVGNLLMSFGWFAMALETVNRFSGDPGTLQRRSPWNLRGFQKERIAENGNKTRESNYWIRPRPRLEVIVLNGANRWMNHPGIWWELRHILGILSRFLWKIRNNTFAILIFILAFLTLLTPGSWYGYLNEEFQPILVSAICYIALIISVFAAASGIAREVESGRLDLLLTTPLSPTRFLLLRAFRIFFGVCFTFLLAEVYMDHLRDMLDIPNYWIDFWFESIALWVFLLGIAVWISLRFHFSPVLNLFLRSVQIFLALSVVFLLTMFYRLAREDYGQGMSQIWIKDWLSWFAPWLVLMGAAFWISSRASRERTAFEMTFGAACLIAGTWMAMEVFLPGFSWDIMILEQLVAGGIVGLLFFLLAMFEVSRKQQ